MDENASLGIKGLIIILFAALNISTEQIGYLLGAIFVDSIFGVATSAKFGREIKFKIFYMGILGKISILFIPFMLALFGVAFKHDLNFIVDAFIYIIAANETLAFFAKIGSLRTGTEYKTKDFVAKAIQMLSAYFQKKMESIINVFNDQKK